MLHFIHGFYLFIYFNFGFYLFLFYYKALVILCKRIIMYLRCRMYDVLAAKTQTINISLQHKWLKIAGSFRHFCSLCNRDRSTTNSSSRRSSSSKRGFCYDDDDDENEIDNYNVGF